MTIEERLEVLERDIQEIKTRLDNYEIHRVDPKTGDLKFIYGIRIHDLIPATRKIGRDTVHFSFARNKEGTVHTARLPYRTHSFTRIGCPVKSMTSTPSEMRRCGSGSMPKRLTGSLASIP